MDNQQQSVPQKSPPAEQTNQRIATPEESRKELREAIKGSNDLLIKCSTAITLFPDTLSLDRAKLTVTKRNFFSSAELISIRIEDILNVTATVGPFFGTIQVASRIPTSEPYTIGKFWRDQALHIKRITQGYVIALQRNIDCNALQTRELAVMLDRLGEDEHAGGQPVIT